MFRTAEEISRTVAYWRVEAITAILMIRELDLLWAMPGRRVKGI